MRNNPFDDGYGNPFTNEESSSEDDDGSKMKLLTKNAPARWLHGEYGEKADWSSEPGALRCNGVNLFIACTLFACCFLAQALLSSQLESVGEQVAIDMQRAIGVDPTTKLFVDISGPTPIPATFYLASVLYWCSESQRWVNVSMRLLLIIPVGMLTKWTLNQMLHEGRPFWNNDRIQMLHCPTDYGSPSGHAMLWLLCIWPIIETLALNDQPRILSRTWRSSVPRRQGCGRLCSALWKGFCILILALFYMNLVVFRVYLGTHYIFDVVFGAVTACMLLSIFPPNNVYEMYNAIPRFRSKSSVRWYRKGIRFLSTSLFFVLVLGTFIAWVAVVGWSFGVFGKGGRRDPKQWQTRARKGCGTTIDTRDLELASAAVGLLCGWTLGASLQSSNSSCASRFCCCLPGCANCPSGEINRRSTTGASRLLLDLAAWLGRAVLCAALLLALTDAVPTLGTLACAASQHVSSTEERCRTASHVWRGFGYFLAMVCVLRCRPKAQFSQKQATPDSVVSSEEVPIIGTPSQGYSSTYL